LSERKQDDNSKNKANLKVQMLGCTVQLALWSEPLAWVNWGEGAGIIRCGCAGMGVAAKAN